MNISAALLDRFRKSLPVLISAEQRIGIAVSGGPDSMALLLLAHSTWPGRIAAATVDHGLRPEAADEALWVANQCAALYIPHHILTPETPITGSLQASARRTRYELLEKWRLELDLSYILTAHHTDDQAETLLMRLGRGAGISGLAAIRSINGYIIRPLLQWRRAELAQIVHSAGMDAIADPSNNDTRFDRVKMRQNLSTAPWLEPVRLAQSASHLADAEQAIIWITEMLGPLRIQQDAAGIAFDPDGLPPELLRRLLRRAIMQLDTSCNPTGPELGHMLEILGAGGQASIGQLLCRGGKIWYIRPAPPRRMGS